MPPDDASGHAQYSMAHFEERELHDEVQSLKQQRDKLNQHLYELREVIRSTQVTLETLVKEQQIGPRAYSRLTAELDKATVIA